jgi:uncharacterized protein
MKINNTRNLFFTVAVSFIAKALPFGIPNSDRAGTFSLELKGSPIFNSSLDTDLCFKLCNSTWGCAAWVFTPAKSTDCPNGFSNSTPLPAINMCSLKYAVANATMSNCSTAGLPEMHLAPIPHVSLPTGNIQPLGWLLDQMKLASSGMTGYLADFFPQVQNSSWIGGFSDTGPSFERAPYWLQGAVQLAHQLKDERLLTRVQFYIEYALEHVGNITNKNLGWLGPDEDTTDSRMYWGKYPFFRALCFHYEATGDVRLPRAIQAHMREMGRRMMPGSGYGSNEGLGVQWSASRVHDLVLSVIFLIELCESGQGDTLGLDSYFLFDFADRLFFLSRNFDYEYFFSSRDRFPLGAVDNPSAGSTNDRMFLHGVDFAQALKSGAVWYRMFGDEASLASSYSRVKRVEKYQGLPSGEICGDEHLCGNSPSQATELCAIVEAISSYSFNSLATGDVFFYDRLELLTLNALAAAFTKTMWGHPYLHQPNEIKAIEVNDPVWFTDGGTANMYGVCVTGVCCCTTNGGKGWPQFLQSAVRVSSDGKGIYIGLLTPSVSIISLKNGEKTEKAFITINTLYPFEDNIQIEMNSTIPINLFIRIPSWIVTGASINTLPIDSFANSFFLASMNSTYTSLLFNTSPVIRIKQWPGAGNGVSIYRGSLLFSLYLEENSTVIKQPWLPLFPNASNFDIVSNTSWNYALVLSDLSNPSKDLTLIRNSIPGSIPFAGGLSTVPLLIQAKARRIPFWTETHDAAGTLPVSPIDCSLDENVCGEIETLYLVPHGTTLLRMTILPFVYE